MYTFHRPSEVKYLEKSVNKMNASMARNHYHKDKSKAEKNREDGSKAEEDREGDSASTCIHERVSLFVLNECADCFCKLDVHRLQSERIHVEIMRKRDAKRLLLPRKNQFHGVRVDWLLAFTFDHQCWDWPTHRVVRDIIVPNTMTARVAYVELDFMQSNASSGAKSDANSDVKTAPPTIFVSHCWENNFGDVVAACCFGASPDRVVFLDLFSLHQWPGSALDLESMPSIVQQCAAVIVSFSPCISLQHGTPPDTFLATRHGAAERARIPICRTWCVSEMMEGMKANIPIILKCGQVQMEKGVDDGASARSTSASMSAVQKEVEEKCGGGVGVRNPLNAVFYDTECGQAVLSGCRDLLNVQRWCECTGEHDQKREMRRILDNANAEARRTMQRQSASSRAAAEEEHKRAANDLEMVASWDADQLKHDLAKYNLKISGKLSILRSRAVERRRNGRVLERWVHAPLRAMLSDGLVAWRHCREHE